MSASNKTPCHTLCVKADNSSADAPAVQLQLMPFPPTLVNDDLNYADGGSAAEH